MFERKKNHFDSNAFSILFNSFSLFLFSVWNNDFFLHRFSIEVNQRKFNFKLEYITYTIYIMWKELTFYGSSSFFVDSLITKMFEIKRLFLFFVFNGNSLNQDFPFTTCTIHVLYKISHISWKACGKIVCFHLGTGSQRVNYIYLKNRAFTINHKCCTVHSPKKLFTATKDNELT